MKTARRLLITLALVSTAFLPTVFLRGQEESPRMKCLQRCQTNLHACLANAKDDEKKKSACNKSLNDCLATCPKP